MRLETLDLIKRLGIKEESFLQKEFISPIFHNNVVVTRVEGIVHKLKISSTMNPGWYKLKANDYKNATIIGSADTLEIEQYLSRLQKIRLILLYKNKDYYLAIPLKNNTLGLSISNPIPVFLASLDSAPFEPTICRFDGANFWFQETDPRTDLEKVEYLQKQFDKYINPDTIRFKGLTVEEKLAYSIRYSIDIRQRELSKEAGLKRDVEHAGGQFVKFIERQDHYSVTYRVDGEEYVSYISKDPAHHVLTAGVCLAGGDSNFDLTSLVTVLREGQSRGLIHRFHNTR